MIDPIQELIQSLTKEHADERLHHFHIEIKSLENNQLTLVGRVLEQADLFALIANLTGKFQPLRVEAGEVEILRKPGNLIMSVGSNITSTHVSTSFGVEMLSQMVYGEKVEILAEQGNWVYCRQMDGYLGWTYKPYLSAEPILEPTHIVMALTVGLHSDPNQDSPVLTRVFSGTRLALVSTEGDWARVCANMDGWMHRSDLHALAVHPQSGQAKRAQMLADALRMIGVPYLWGGTTGNGIDCSGFARLLHRWLGIDIPRDADLQSVQCKSIDTPGQAGDLFFFGEGGGTRKITHVGLSMGGWKVMHSSRNRNGVYLDDMQEKDSLRSILVHTGTFIDD